MLSKSLSSPWERARASQVTLTSLRLRLDSVPVMQATQLVVEQTQISNRFLAHLCSRILWLTRKDGASTRCQASSAKSKLNAIRPTEVVIWTVATMWVSWSWEWASIKLKNRFRSKMVVNQKLAIFLAKWSHASNAREPNSILRVEIVRHAKDQAVYR